MIKYAFSGLAKNGESFHELYETKSRRQSKVLKQIEIHLLEKYKLTFLDLVDFQFKQIKQK